MIESEYDISGAITFWSLKPTPYQAIREVFGNLGYGNCVPNPRTDQSALENSIKTVCGTKNRAVVSRKQPKRNGVELVEIDRDVTRNSYTTSFGAKVVDGRVHTDYGYADEYRLTLPYRSVGHAARADREYHTLKPQGVSYALSFKPQPNLLDPGADWQGHAIGIRSAWLR